MLIWKCPHTDRRQTYYNNNTPFYAEGYAERLKDQK